jgi:Heterokaryon incompatibility protein (HET)
MRLLEDRGDGNLSLVEYYDNIPRYAILSHTWGSDGEEVTYRDIIDGIGKHKAGYKKLQFCNAQAVRDNIQYFWVDTCCIDKSSSAELTEAINSMFRWYQRASKCYVYLSDVSVAPSLSSNWEAEFRSSRWFTRCWTLQELIAPASVEFFSQDGSLLGNKSSLEQEIYEITRIPIEALRGAPLAQFEVEERLSWAERREAKRPEDKAYSLLGILNVHLPLIYGEGNHSYVRLREEIRLSIADTKDGSRSLSAIPTYADGITGSIDGSSHFLFESKAALEIQTLDQTTDSGYGGSSAIKSQPHGKQLGEPTSTALTATIPESQAEYAEYETQTVYSDTESLRDPKLLQYVTAFADELYGSLPHGFDKAEFERVSPVLDELLRTFALKMSCDGSTSEHRNLTYLVHRYRR